MEEEQILTSSTQQVTKMVQASMDLGDKEMILPNQDLCSPAKVFKHPIKIWTKSLITPILILLAMKLYVLFLNFNVSVDIVNYIQLSFHLPEFESASSTNSAGIE